MTRTNQKKFGKSSGSSPDAKVLTNRISAEISAHLEELVPANSSCALIDFPNYSNVGDSAIWLGEKHFLQSRRVKVLYACDYSTYSREQMAQRISKESIILLHGGGNMGDIWPWHQHLRECVIQDFPQNQIIALPQSIHFQSKDNLLQTKKIFDSHQRFSILVRDRPSLELAANAFVVPARLCPDMAFLLGSLPHRPSPRYLINALLRTDAEAAGDSFVPQAEDVIVSDWLEESSLFITLNKHLTGKWKPGRKLWQRYYQPKNLTYDLYAKLRLARGINILGQGKVVITDRLHGYILSLLMQIPHVLLDNNYGKLRSFYDTWKAECTLTHWSNSRKEALEIARALL